ncbi:calcium-binding protein [Rhodalgimonas zhirmunskyi]|uniref:calcium-binding protein n=1 Tax=Rhodalgimonas zhirmunskyi TaxID=2964767 RepID=UPI0029529538|nr:hypothetical protein [Rhodoalgimonas zhirmunskyi]
MATGDDLKTFRTNLAHTYSNANDLRGKVDAMGDAVDKARQALEYPEKVEDQAAEFMKTVKSMKFSLKVVEKVGPMKVVAKVVKKVLDELEDVADRIRQDARDLKEKIEDSGYIEKLEDMKSKLDDYEVGIYGVEQKLLGYEASTASMIAGFEVIGAPVDPVEGTVDSVVSPLNTVLADANALYDTIEAEIDGVGSFLSNFKINAFGTVISVAKDFSAINSALSFLKGPLNAVYSALKPIEGLLDAVGFIYNITVGPVVDWILDKLGITKIMDKVADKIADLLPDADILNGIEAKIDTAFVEVDDFLGTLGWNTDIADFVDQITDQVFAGINGDADDPVRIGTDSGEVLYGRDGVNDVLNGGGGDDTIYGLSGDDMIIASAGDDVVYGGAGHDRLVMGDTLLNYTFNRPSEDGPVIFRHVDGDYGLEAAHDVEEFVFSNGSYSWQQLRDNVKLINGTSETGTGADEVFYAVTGSGSVTIDGAAGNDQITGSEFADSLLGGTGNDQFTSNRGADTVDGGAGNDTWIYAENDASGNPLTQVDLVTGQTWDGDSRDTLISIENILMQDNRDTDLFGNAVANIIVGGAGEDWIDGRGGNDSLVGGAGRDLLIGGAGVDTLLGGDHNDKLVAGGFVVAGQGETYDGGDGHDTLIYSSQYRSYDIEPRQFTQIAAQDPSGPLRIFTETGRIERLSANGATVLAVDTATNIEHFIGSDENDTLHGSRPVSGSQLIIDGGGGDDTLYSNGATETRGGDGDDLMYVVDGGSFDGGSGVDTLDTRTTDARFFIRLTGAIGTTLRAYKVDESDSFTTETGTAKSLPTSLFSGNLNNTEIVYLGKHDDEVRLEGSERMTIYGGDGDDILIRDVETDGTGSGAMHGQLGNDYLELRTSGALYGGLGDDTLVVNAHGGGDGHIIFGGDGNDSVTVSRIGSSTTPGTINGGDGSDRLSIEVRDFSTTSDERLDLNLRSGVMQSFSTDRFGESVAQINARVSNFEEIITSDMRDLVNGTDSGERFVSRSGNDTVYAHGGNDELFGGDGNDILDGGEGDDLLHGGAGVDTLRGGNGIDTASYINAAPGTLDGSVVAGNFGGVQLTLGEGAAAGIASTAAGNDILYAIENVIGSSANDQINGNNGENALYGGDGNDTLFGYGGNDILVTGKGNDYAEGGDGNDLFVLDLGDTTIHGGNGFDKLDLGTLAGQVSIELGSGSVTGTFEYDAPVWRDTQGTETRLWDGVWLSPQDVLEAEAAFANSSDDLTRDLPSDGTPDALAFEIMFATASQSFSVTYTSIEHIIGGESNDSITGRSADDTLDAGGGNDTLWGYLGADTLYAGTGNDAVYAAAGDDRVWGGDGHDLVHLGAGHDVFYDNAPVEDPGRDTVYGHGGNDTFQGGNGDDVFFGGTGNDHLFGRLGGDELFGGDGFDTLDAGDGNDQVTGGNGRDLAYLGNGNDLFVDNDQGGDLGRDTVFGGLGEDTIQGGNGNDEFHGMLHDDLILGRLGDDLIYGGDGFDVLHGGDGNDTVSGGNGRDTVFLNNGNDFFLDNSQGGDLGRDTVYGGAGHDTIQGGNGNDLFFGGDGNDLILARLGDDRLNGGRGNDTLNGGEGADTFVFDTEFGNDIVQGFAKGVDALQLDDALWTGSLTKAQVINQFASVVAGNTVFEFGANDITLIGVNSLLGLESDLVIA